LEEELRGLMRGVSQEVATWREKMELVLDKN
jgi:hypothetical protein